MIISRCGNGFLSLIIIIIIIWGEYFGFLLSLLYYKKIIIKEETALVLGENCNIFIVSELWNP